MTYLYTEPSKMTSVLPQNGIEFVTTMKMETFCEQVEVFAELAAITMEDPCTISYKISRNF